MRAPGKSSPRRSAASDTLAQADSICPAGCVSVVGTQDVVPFFASASDASSMPSGSQSITSRSTKPWMCVST